VQRSVVCISATDGAGAGEVARLVADGLGFRLIDEEIVLRAAAEAGVDPHVVADAERRQSLLTRLLRGLGPSADRAAYALAGIGPIGPFEVVEADPDLRELIRTAIGETAAQGSCVIVAHAASVALAQRVGTLRVLVTASVETRARRLARARELDEKEAATAVAQADAGRAEYLKRFYDLEVELPTHYDLVVNTDRVAPQEAAALIAQAARLEEVPLTASS
jgi:cytidylate kinase